MNKKNNILKIFVVIVCLFAVTLFALIQSGDTPGFIQRYKNNFKINISAICNILHIELPIETQLYLEDMSTPSPKPTMTPADNEDLSYPVYDEEIEEAHGTDALTTQAPQKAGTGDYLPIALTAAENARYTNYKDSIVCVSETAYQAYSAGGKQLWSQGIQMQSPILKHKGDYILICEEGAKKVNLYKGKKLIFGTKTEGDIITASLSEKGDVVLVTEKDSYKAQVVVLNKSGKKIFAWDSGAYDVLDAAISNGRHVSVALLNTDEGADSMITCMDVKGNTKFKTEVLKNMIVFSLDYTGEKLTALSESKYIGISSKGKILWEYGFDGKKLNRFDTDKNGNRILLFESGSTGELVTVTPGGKSYAPIQTESMPDTIDIKSNRIAYNSGREVVMTDLKGKNIYRADCGSDIKQVHIIDSKRAMCVYSSSIQVKNTKKQEPVKATPNAETPLPEEQTQQ
ncbi:MAG: DUF5711 family protein [Clostridiales bacterium]|nr:DUF5711 family protein [Clostridiales bacterium]